MKLAVKLLKRSDLTFFEPLYRLLNAGNQKSLNLNRSVLIDRFYPALAETKHKALIPIRLDIWGPDAAGQLQLSRSITKEAKNWRLNGEFVHNPDVEPERFDSLAPGDIALLRFDGISEPDTVKLVLVSASAALDIALHTKLVVLAGSSMRAVTQDELLTALEAAPPNHPARDLVQSGDEIADLEDAAGGDAAAAFRVTRRRNVTREELSAARERAGEIGVEGESLIAQWLTEQQDAGAIRRWHWVAEENAVHPFDFEVELLGGEVICVEVKSTTCPHARPFHISIAEVTAAAGTTRYDLYRLSGLSDGAATLRRSSAIGVWATELLASLATLPPGVWPQSFLVDPCHFAWTEPEEIAQIYDDEDV
jgi:hypothetical protein